MSETGGRIQVDRKVKCEHRYKEKRDPQNKESDEVCKEREKKEGQEI